MGSAASHLITTTVEPAGSPERLPVVGSPVVVIDKLVIGRACIPIAHIGVSGGNPHRRRCGRSAHGGKGMIKMAAVKIAIDDRDLPPEWRFQEPIEVVWLIEIDENYSLENVQRALVESNRDKFGENARVSCEIGRVRSYKKLIAWAHRKRKNRFGHPPLTGWCGPVRLDPDALGSPSTIIGAVVDRLTEAK